MNKKPSVSIYFTKNEYERVEKAIENSILDWNPLVKLMIKNGLEKIGKTEKLVFEFDKSNVVEKNTYKTKVVRMDDKGYKELMQICACTPFSMSNLAKYIIMPQIDQIIEKKGVDYKP